MNWGSGYPRTVSIVLALQAPMITLTETIEVYRDQLPSCFRYVADFRTTVEWDATAVEANKLTPRTGRSRHSILRALQGWTWTPRSGLRDNGIHALAVPDP